MEIKLRYNTENKTDQFWRLIVDGVEETCSALTIKCPTYTTQDNLPDGWVKFHITVMNPTQVVRYDKEIVII